MTGEPAETLTENSRDLRRIVVSGRARSAKNLLEHVLQRVFAASSARAQVLLGAFMLRTDAERGAEFSLGACVHTERFVIESERKMI